MSTQDATALPPAVARSAFAGLATVGRHGRTAGSAGITVSELTDVAFATLIARQGQHAAVSAAIEARFGVAPPAGPRHAGHGDIGLIGTGPGQWLVRAQGVLAADLLAKLRQAVEGLAAVADQSDGRGVLRIAGPNARDLMIRGVPLDLHPRSFGLDSAAQTVCAHVDVLVWQVDAAPTYELVVARGFAGSLWHWLEETAAPYGLAVVPAV